MAFNIIFPCEVDIVDDSVTPTAIAKISPTSFNMSDSAFTSNLGTNVLSFTNLSTPNQSVARYSYDEMRLYDVSGSNQTQRFSVNKNNLSFYDVSGNQYLGITNNVISIPASQTETLQIGTEINFLISGVAATTIASQSITTPVIKPANITDSSNTMGSVNQLLTSTATGIKWNSTISPVNISDVTNSLGTNGQVLTKQASGIQWSPNLPNLATYKRSWANTSVTITNANTLLYTSDAVITGTATATFLITFQMTAQSTGNHSLNVTVARGTVTPATDQAYNLAKPGANNLTSTISPFGSNLGTFGGGSPITTSTISFTDTPGSVGSFYYSIWCLANTNNATSQWSNFNVLQIKA
jgi:hypothetical protein